MQGEIVPMARVGRGAPMTHPAELVKAEATGHVVAALGSLEPSFAHRTP